MSGTTQDYSKTACTQAHSGTSTSTTAIAAKIIFGFPSGGYIQLVGSGRAGRGRAANPPRYGSGFGSRTCGDVEAHCTYLKDSTTARRPTTLGHQHPERGVVDRIGPVTRLQQHAPLAGRTAVGAEKVRNQLHRQTDTLRDHVVAEVAVDETQVWVVTAVFDE